MRIRRGFSLIEVMVVVGIAGILASIAIPLYLEFARRSKLAERRVVVERVRRDLLQMYGNGGKGPWGAGPGATNWNPPLPANGVYTRARWDRADVTWMAFDFSTEGGLFCRYLVHSGTPEHIVYIDVQCDLDADGQVCTWSEGIDTRANRSLNCFGATQDAECDQHLPVSGTTSGDNDCAG